MPTDQTHASPVYTDVSPVPSFSVVEAIEEKLFEYARATGRKPTKMYVGRKQKQDLGILLAYGVPEVKSQWDDRITYLIGQSGGCRMVVRGLRVYTVDSLDHLEVA